MKIKSLKTSLFIVFLVVFGLSIQAQRYKYSNNWGKQGFTIKDQKTNSIEFIYSVEEFVLSDISIDGKEEKNVLIPNVFLPGSSGMPNLPVESKMIAIPEGSSPQLKILSTDVEIIKNVDIAPAPIIPLDTEEEMIYEKNDAVYSRNAFYPENPFQVSAVQQLRGVDYIMVGVSPFQYNPATKELKVYKNISLEVVHQGGNGHYGETSYRSRFWDPILKQMLFNADAMPTIDYSERLKHVKNNEFEYVIITLNDPDFLAWANTIAEFRRQQGIVTGVFSIDEVGGNTVSAIESWIDNAYNNWTLKPVAVLLLGDYSTGPDGIVSHLYPHPNPMFPNFASDNKYADIDGDELPDISIARITARNSEELEVMVSKVLDYETDPPTDANFYSSPVTALGWQTERWFQICSEVIGGFWKNELGKTPVRINEVYIGDPNTDPWSTAPNTPIIIDYFGPNGLGYIPATPNELGGWENGTALDVINAINDGAFMVQHRDHGFYSGWGEPEFMSDDINSLTNTDNRLPFVFSVNCQTGAFHSPPQAPDECFTENFHRYSYNGQNAGALGVIAATETSYSFVNDTYICGVYDNFWPEFMPNETTEFPTNYVYPSFGNAAGKYFLQASSWPANPEQKEVTHRLFHHHGDAFLNVFTEVPQELSILSDYVHFSAYTEYVITADEGADIALTYYDTASSETVILATGIGTGSPITLNLSECPPVGTDMLLTITKQNYFRYTKNVLVIEANGPYLVLNGFIINDGGNNQAEFGESFNLDLELKNLGIQNSEGITATLTTADPNVAALTNATNVPYPNLVPNASFTSSNNFTVELADDIINKQLVNFNLTISDNSTKETYNTELSFKVNAPELTIGDVFIDDAGSGNGNGVLDPGETADIVIYTHNTGDADVTNINASIATTSTYFTINNPSYAAPSIAAGNVIEAAFSVTAEPDVPTGVSAEIEYSITAGENNQYSASETKEISIGEAFEYCTSYGDCINPILSVIVANIDNTSSCDGGYANYTDIIGYLEMGSSYDISVYAPQGTWADKTELWIDWNCNGNFDEEEGNLLDWDFSTTTATGTIDVPANIQPRLYTMRIVHACPFGDLEPCGSYNFGETEDYSLEVIGCCGGTATANPMWFCESGTTTLTLNGYAGSNIQWQESTDGSTWNDIAGATSDEYTSGTLTESYYFRAKVTETGYDPAYSNELMIEAHKNPIAGFTFTQNIGELTFTNTSEFADSYSWDFGDNAGTSTSENPIYEYSANGTYTVELTASNTNCGNNQVSETIEVIEISINELAQHGIELYPNPNKGEFYINSKDMLVMEIINYTGKIVYRETILKGKSNINIANLPTGTYFVKFITKNKVLVSKIIKN